MDQRRDDEERKPSQVVGAPTRLSSTRFQVRIPLFSLWRVGSTLSDFQIEARHRALSSRALSFFSGRVYSVLGQDSQNWDY